MFAIVWYWALAAIFIAALLYIYIDYRQVQVDWGTGLGGLRLQLAVQAILSAGREVSGIKIVESAINHFL